MIYYLSKEARRTHTTPIHIRLLQIPTIFFPFLCPNRSMPPVHPGSLRTARPTQQQLPKGLQYLGTHYLPSTALVPYYLGVNLDLTHLSLSLTRPIRLSFWTSRTIHSPVGSLNLRRGPGNRYGGSTTQLPHLRQGLFISLEGRRRTVRGLHFQNITHLILKLSPFLYYLRKMDLQHCPVMPLSCCQMVVCLCLVASLKDP